MKVSVQGALNAHAPYLGSQSEEEVLGMTSEEECESEMFVWSAN